MLQNLFRRKRRAETSAETPIELLQVLSTEYQALRPGSKFTCHDKKELFDKVHREPHPFSALCISGGGIRSATFGLGVLQGLAKHGILERFDYLSTVSGGGYIGGWLTAWANRAGGLKNVLPRLRDHAPPSGPGEPDPIQHLRDYNNYLSPKLGLFSRDTWTLLASALRNIILNWLVLIPLLMFVLMMPRLLLSVLSMGEREYWYRHTVSSFNDSIVIVHLPYVAAFLLGYTFFSTMRYLPGVGRRPHESPDFLWNCLIPLIGAAFCLLVYDSLYDAGKTSLDLPYSTVFLWTLTPLIAGWLVFLLVCGKTLKEAMRLLVGYPSLAILFLSLSTSVPTSILINDYAGTFSWPAYVTIFPPLLLLSYDLAVSLFVGLTSGWLKDEDREWFARSSAWFLLCCVWWIAACGLVLLVPKWAFKLFEWNEWGPSALTAIIAVSGWASTLNAPVTDSPGPGLNQVVSLAKRVALKLAPWLFIVTLCVGLMMLTNWLFLQMVGLHYPTDTSYYIPVEWSDHDALLKYMPWGWPAAFGVAFLLMAWLTARVININKFSLHGMYRNRLVRAYLGASNPERYSSEFTVSDETGSLQHRPLLSWTFTGFAESDNLSMHRLNVNLKPFHVVNVALNLVAGGRLAWQQRKAQSFTITPLHCGNYELGYRPSAEYGGPGGISLGTAVTISGAAASPNMGYHSSPGVGLIMTLLNARLGAWLGNPGVAGTRTWKEAGPRTAIGSLVKEALGLTTNRSEYVYLSDGGHFENLGLYEMVLRRCRFIVVLDASGDPEFTYEDLGNAIRKIRIDLKIPIKFDDERMGPLRQLKRRCMVSTIGYSAVDGSCEDGYLIYIKPMCVGNEPPDVETYKKAHPDFPHQSTADQWFDESQTESYRMLGLHTIDELCQGWKGGSVEDFRRHVERNYLGVKLPDQSVRAQGALLPSSLVGSGIKENRAKEEL